MSIICSTVLECLTITDFIFACVSMRVNVLFVVFIDVAGVYIQGGLYVMMINLRIYVSWFGLVMSLLGFHTTILQLNVSTDILKFCIDFSRDVGCRKLIFDT